MLLPHTREVLPQGGLGEVIQVEVERGADWRGARSARQSRGVRQLGSPCSCSCSCSSLEQEREQSELAHSRPCGLSDASCAASRRSTKCGASKLRGAAARRNGSAAARRNSSSVSEPATRIWPSTHCCRLTGAIEMSNRIQPARRLGQSGQQGAFSGAEVAQWFGEVELRCRRAAAVEVAVVEAIQVGGEDALLVPDLFEPQRLRGLDELGAECARARFGELDELLGDGRAAGHDVPMARHLPGRANGGTPIHAGVLPEPPVFGGERGLDQCRWNLAILNDPAEGLILRADAAQRPPRAIQDLQLWNLSANSADGSGTQRSATEPTASSSPASMAPVPTIQAARLSELRLVNAPPFAGLGSTSFSVRCWMLDVGCSMFVFHVSLPHSAA